MGPSCPTQKSGHSPQFSAHVYYGQTAGWIKIPLGTDAGLSPGDIVLDGDAAAPSQKKGHNPQFRPTSIVAKRSPISATTELLLDSPSLAAMHGWLNRIRGCANVTRD